MDLLGSLARGDTEEAVDKEGERGEPGVRGFDLSAWQEADATIEMGWGLGPQAKHPPQYLHLYVFSDYVCATVLI